MVLFTISLFAKTASYQLSQGAYEAIMQAQQLLDANKSSQAITNLKKARKSRKVVTPLDRAYVEFYVGYCYTVAEKFDDAATYFEQALAHNALPPQQRSSSYLILVQYYSNAKAYKKALHYLDKLIAITKPKKAQYYIYKANIYLLLQEYRHCIAMVNQAIAITQTPKKQWYQMAFYSYYMLKEYASAVAMLEELIRIEPDSKEVWLQLSSVFSLNNEAKRALAALDITRIEPFALTQSQRLRLISWLQYEGVPYKAAELLQYSLQNNEINGTAKHYAMLGDLYIDARAYEKAKHSYMKSLNKEQNATIHFKLAQIFLTERNYAEVLKQTVKSLQLSPKDSGQKHLLIGESYFQLNNLEEASKAFRAALSDRRSKKSAQSWLQFLEQL